MIFYSLKLEEFKNNRNMKKTIAKRKSKTEPESIVTTEIAESIDKIGAQIEKIAVNVDSQMEPDFLDFPLELLEMEAKKVPTDDDEILCDFEPHDPEKEYKDVIYYHDLLSGLVQYLKCVNRLKLSTLQQEKINNLIERLYEKMVIYQKHIDLAPTNPVNADLDEAHKDKLRIIGTMINKLRDITAKMRTKKSFLKKDLLPILNHSKFLFNEIIEYIHSP
jgi:hypothetical protein